jgi:hypothetical protein
MPHLQVLPVLCDDLFPCDARELAPLAIPRRGDPSRSTRTRCTACRTPSPSTKHIPPSSASMATASHYPLRVVIHDSPLIYSESRTGRLTRAVLRAARRPLLVVLHVPSTVISSPLKDRKVQDV